MTHDLRVLTDPAEVRQALEVFSASVVDIPRLAPDVDLAPFTEPGGQLGVFVDGEMVGTAASFRNQLVVPGGVRVSHAAVTDVGVLPTHTRQGLGAALMRAQLAQIAERGEVVATLRASEAVIYERFGYGVASSAASVDLLTTRARLRPGVAPGGRLRFVDPATSWDLLERIYQGVERPGTIQRWPGWWKVQQFIGKDKNPSYVVVHGEPGAEDGFVRYHPQDTDSWFTSTDRAIQVVDLVAATDAAHHGLIRFLLSIDLVHRVELVKMPVDHSIEKLVLDERAVRTTGVFDETWLRLVDVLAALAARTYRGSEAVVIEVGDALLPANDGRYRISAAGAEPTTAPADLALEVSALAAVYLGGTAFWHLAAAGRVRELTEGALSRAEQLFATDRAPYAGTGF